MTNPKYLKALSLSVTMLAALAVSVLLLAITEEAPVAVAQEAPAKPNIIYIVADDLDKNLLFSMPNIKTLIADQGVRLNNFYIPQSQCCPSRATALTGKYVHNHKVTTNNAPAGGFAKFRQEGLDPGNVAGPVEANGYQSALLGKFLNEYGPQTSSSAYEGANWSRWFGVFNQKRYSWSANSDGSVVSFGTEAKDYVDDVLWVKTRNFIYNRASNGIPMFVYWSPLAPHGEGKNSYPAPPGYENMYSTAQSPSRADPAYDEADVSDKPSFIRDNPRLTSTQKTQIDQNYRGRARMLRNIDDQVKELVEGLRTRGQLENTYIVITSDNGWMQGEHRIDDAKLQPYEEASNVGMLVRGPGIPAGVTLTGLASAHDLYATFTDMSGAEISRDGRSLLPLLEGKVSWTRRSLLLENLSGLDGARPNYYGIVTSDGYKYVEYQNGEKELYNLKIDPHELNSFDETADPTLLSNLKNKLNALKVCAGDSCRAAEDGP